MRIYQRFKELIIWSLVFVLIFLNFSVIISFPLKIKAADFNFTGSHFTAKSDGTLTHTYTVNGTQKTQTYSGQVADDGHSVYKNGTSFFGHGLYIYQMGGSQTHQNWGKNCRENAIIKPKTSPYFIVVEKVDDNTYQTVGIYFKQQCTNVGACGNAGTNILAEEYYFQTQDFSFSTGDDCQNVYDTNSEFYKYLEYVNSRDFSVDGLTSGEKSNPCSISGKIDIDFSKQNLTGTETGVQQWSDLKKKQYFGDLEFRAQLWYKGPGASTFISADETAVIQDDGTYTFEAKQRPTGQYIVTATIKRTKNSPSFEPGSIDPSFENQELNLIDPSFYPAFSDQGDMEYFFGKSSLIELKKDCSNFTGQNITLASIGIKEQKATSSADTCGVDCGLGIFCNAIAGVLCALIQGIAALSSWLTNAIFQGVFNA